MIQHQFTVYDMFLANAASRPDRTAIVDAGRSVSFRHLNNHVKGLATWMHVQGIRSGDRVAILAMNRYEYLVIYGAAAALGAIAVPMNWRLSEPELLHILNDSGAVLLFFDTTYQEAAENLKASADLLNSNLLVQTMAPLPETEGIETDIPIGSAGPDDLFCLIYTAAVAGKPRGAALSHANIIASNLQTALTMGIIPDNTYLNMLPLCHITGINFFLTLMHVGGRNVIMEKFEAGKAVDLIKSESVTHLASFPPILSMLLAEVENQKDIDLSQLQVTGIDSPDTIAAFTDKTGGTFWVLYGQCETSGFVTLSRFTDFPGSAGSPGCLSRVSIRDDQDRDVPNGESGEISVRGPLVFQGYWSGSGLDTRSFRNDWHRTGDIGKLDNNGYLWFQGRKPEKELIKPGGENVYPAEVEAVILEHPDIVETSVIGVPDPKFGEGIKAVCIKTPGSSLTEEELITFVAGRIARYKKPGYVQFTDALPKTNDGNIDRIKVKELFTAS